MLRVIWNVVLTFYYLIQLVVYVIAGLACLAAICLIFYLLFFYPAVLALLSVIYVMVIEKE